MQPTRIVTEGHLPRPLAEPVYPRFLSAHALRWAVPASADHEAKGCTSVQVLLDQVMAAIHAFTAELSEHGTRPGSVVNGTIRVVATRTYLMPDPCRANLGAEAVFVVSASLVRVGEGADFSALMGDGSPRPADHSPWLPSLPGPYQP
jgi:hypothetical protein